MTSLSHQARLVVNDGKDAHQPTNADRLRVTELLAKQVGAASLGIASSAQAASGLASSHSLPMLLKVIGAIGLTAMGGAFYAASRKPPLVVSPPNDAVVVQLSAVPAPPRVQATSPVQPAETVELAASAQPVPAEQAPRASRSRSDSLGEEVAILTQAGRELRNGRPEAALKALDEHQRKFPSGALAQERARARIQALCALGRTSQATAESARLARTSPAQLPLAVHPCTSNDRR